MQVKRLLKAAHFAGLLFAALLPDLLTKLPSLLCTTPLIFFSLAVHAPAFATFCIYDIVTWDVVLSMPTGKIALISTGESKDFLEEDKW